ncbi:hypothetical protein [Allorhodopirellula solitaria]|uniref:Uncharacterized protein n=1 Tax=Allorhodopirellula solitaria TaxID=2527987 RepID=A0A5C5X8B7_9BACT|nr:hypothetical protein [Allorhodopirellula solitaria]TWT59256.1 hypothetical protein CA85_39520 [Allorhodopirellula solitaria]
MMTSFSVERLLRSAALVPCVLLGLLAIVGTTGCDATGTSESASGAGSPNSEHLLQTPPADPMSLTQAAEDLSAEQASGGAAGASQEMVLIGKIDAGDFPAFQAGQATFMLSELPAEGHGLDDPDHEDNCPFCKRRAEKAPKAIVNLVGADGDTLATDARELLGVAEGDRVMVVGSATFDEAVNAITLQCHGVYFKR